MNLRDLIEEGRRLSDLSSLLPQRTLFVSPKTYAQMHLDALALQCEELERTQPVNKKHAQNFTKNVLARREAVDKLRDLVLENVEAQVKTTEKLQGLMLQKNDLDMKLRIAEMELRSYVLGASGEEETVTLQK